MQEQLAKQREEVNREEVTEEKSSSDDVGVPPAVPSANVVSSSTTAATTASSSVQPQSSRGGSSSVPQKSASGSQASSPRKKVDMHEARTISVKIVRGENLKNVDKFGTIDPYVTVKLIARNENSSEKIPKDWEQKTRVVDNETNPKWNATFNFFLSGGLRQLQAIKLKVKTQNVEYNSLSLSLSFFICGVFETSIRIDDERQTDW